MGDQRCQAEWNDHPSLGNDYKMDCFGWLICLLDADHEGPHEGWEPIPCPTCCGFDMHVDGCPAIELVTNDIVFLRFDDDGWMWADRRDGTEGHYEYPGKASKFAVALGQSDGGD